MPKSRKHKRAARSYEAVVRMVVVYEHGQSFASAPCEIVTLEKAEEWESQGSGEFHRNRTLFQMGKPRANNPEAGDSALGEPFIMACLDGMHSAQFKLSLLRPGSSNLLCGNRNRLILPDLRHHTHIAAA